MRWPVVLLVGYILIGLQMGLNEYLRLGQTTTVPSFVMPLVVFVALFAQPVPAVWTALLLGLTMDLATPRGTSVIIVGPHALGFVVAAYLVLTVRAIMMRRNPFTIMVLSMAGVALSELVMVSIFSIRAAYPDPFAWHPMPQLAQRMLGALYTAATGLGLSFILLPMQPLFRFQEQHARRRI